MTLGHTEFSNVYWHDASVGRDQEVIQMVERGWEGHSLVRGVGGGARERYGEDVFHIGH